MEQPRYTPAPVYTRAVAPLVVDRETALAPTAPMLIALNRTGKHIYGGTVPEHVKAARRKAGKAAKIARRGNR